VSVVVFVTLAVAVTIIRVRRDTAPTFAPSKLETSLQRSLAASGLSSKTVDCPSELSARAGETFDCKVTGSDRTSANVHVTVVSPQLRVHLSGLVNTVLVRRELIAQVQSASGVPVAATCPDIVALDLGARFRCTVKRQSGGGTSYTATIVSRSGEVRLQPASG
jgi:Domain of unknown function (DUF4333)